MKGRNVFAEEITFVLVDRQTGERRVATRDDIKKILAELGLEIVPIGTVNWGRHPDADLMERRIADLTEKIAALTKKDPVAP